jgi:hypothetical protein
MGQRAPGQGPVRGDELDAGASATISGFFSRHANYTVSARR